MSGQERKNKLYYGDNLDVMRKSIGDESVDLIYLDPPFKSNLDYNILYRADGLKPDEAQWTAFKDTWLWDEGAEKALTELQDIPNPKLVGLINALAVSMERSPMLAYVVNMALRLIEMHKKLKPTGSIYLHCDPTASHYLKLVMDMVFDPRNFRNEIIWCRSTPKAHVSRRFPSGHDVILFYGKSETTTFNMTYMPHNENYVDSHYTHFETGSGRRYRLDNLINPNRNRPNLTYEFPPESGTVRVWRWTKERMMKAWEEGRVVVTKKGGVAQYKRYLDEQPGAVCKTVWADIPPINSQAKERLGYPTQKPEALLERIINASSNEDDLVLDPFCGCGTSVAVAQRLKRRWIGIDVSPFAIELIRSKRLGRAFPDLKVGIDYLIDGLPTTLDGARLLAEQDKKAFEIWAVSRLDGIPNEKKGADKGIDGRIPFKPDGKTSQFAVISVKGGKLKADDIRAISHVAKREKASSLGFGILVSLYEPTQGMCSDAAGAGTATINNRIYPLVQIMTIEEILHGKSPQLPFIDRSVALKDAPIAEIETQDKLFQ